MFHNADKYRAPYPDEPRRRYAEFCAPRVEGGAVVEVIHRTLAARAAHLRDDGAAAPGAGWNWLLGTPVALEPDHKASA